MELLAYANYYLVFQFISTPRYPSKSDPLSERTVTKSKWSFWTIISDTNELEPTFQALTYNYYAAALASKTFFFPVAIIQNCVGSGFRFTTLLFRLAS